MQLKIAKHSQLLRLPIEVQEGLYKSRVIPIVDSFYDLWGDRSPIIILVGTYGSGKSYFAVDDLINKCVTDNYFRCYYGRKIRDDVRGSIFSTIHEQIEAHNIPGFTYSKANTSSMIITHENGNKFIPFGADNIDKLKSIKEPSHFLLEELDQFTADDFGMCVSRLGRTAKAQTQLIGMCNTEKIFEDHWLYKVVFGENKMAAKIHRSSYRQNTLLPSIEEYEKILRIRAMGDEDLYNAIANGMPGIRNRENAWIHVNYERCITEERIDVIPGNTIYLSFDFNNEPMTCTAWQFSSGRHPMDGHPPYFIHAVAEFEVSMKDTQEELVELLCKKIKAVFSYHPLTVTGDASANSRLKGLAGNRSVYYLIAKYLKISPTNLNVPKSNPEHTISRALCNLIMYNHQGIKISKLNTPNMLADIRRAKADPEKQDQLVKGDRGKDLGMDYFDTFRYIFSTYFAYMVR